MVDIQTLATPTDADAVGRALLAPENNVPEPLEDPMPADRVRWEHLREGVRAVKSRRGIACNRSFRDPAGIAIGMKSRGRTVALDYGDLAPVLFWFSISNGNDRRPLAATVVLTATGTVLRLGDKRARFPL